MGLTSVGGIGPATEAKLEAAGVTTVEQLAAADAASLAERTGLTVGRLEVFIERAATEAGETESATDLIDAQIEELADWRGEVLARVRRLVTQADPDVVEEVKWRKPTNPGGVPTWSHDGIICTGETYKNKVKLTFARGAALDDPAGLFNASLGGNTRRAIDIREGDEFDDEAFTAMVRAAVALNTSEAR